MAHASAREHLLASVAETAAPPARRFMRPAAVARVLDCSRPYTYALAKAGRLDMVKIEGRTLITIESLQALLDSAVPYRPDGTSPRGRAARTRAAEAAQRAA